MHELPVNIQTNIASFLLPTNLKLLTLYNFGEYLDYRDLTSFRETNTGLKKIADGALTNFVDQIIKHLGMRLNLPINHVPTQGYHSVLEFIKDAKDLHKSFNNIENQKIYFPTKRRILLSGIEEVNFPEKNVVMPYLFHLFCQAFPIVGSNLCIYEAFKVGFDKLEIKEISSGARVIAPIVPRLTETIREPALNGNISALYALRFYNLLKPDYADTEVAIDLLSKNSSDAKNNSLDQAIFRAWSLNYDKSKHLTNEDLSVYKNIIIDKLIKDKIENSAGRAAELLQRLLTNALLTTDFDEAMDACLSTPSFEKIKIDNFGTKSHIDLALYSTKISDSDDVSDDDKFLKNKIELLLKTIWFDVDGFRSVFNNIQIQPGRVTLLNKYLEASIYDPLDNLIKAEEGAYGNLLMLPWIKLYTEWPEILIDFFVQLWHRYIANQLDSLIASPEEFYLELNNLFNIITPLFYLAKFKHVNINTTTKHLQQVINLLTLTQLSKIAAASSKTLLILLEMDSIGFDKLAKFIEYKKIFDPIIGQINSDDAEEIEIEKIIFFINYHHIFQVDDNKDKNLLTNSMIDEIPHKLRDMLIKYCVTFREWRSDLFIDFCTKKHEQLQLKILSNIDFDNVIVNNENEYCILLDILKSSAAKIGVNIISEFGFEFAQQVSQYQIESRGSLLDYLAKQPDTEWDNLCELIAQHKTDIPLILDALSLKRKSTNDAEPGNKYIKIDEKNGAGPSSSYSSNSNTLFNQKPVDNTEDDTASNDNEPSIRLRRS